MNLVLKESNSPFWILGVGKNKVFEAPFHSKSKTKQKEAAEELMKDNEKIEEVYVVSGNIWDNMPGNTKDSIGYIKNKGTKLLSRSDLKESDYPKGVSRDPLPKKGAKVITNAGMALEKSIKPKLKDDKIKTDETLTEAIPVDKIVSAVLFAVDNWDTLKDIIETIKSTSNDVYEKCMTIFNYLKDKNADVKDAAQEIGNVLVKNESTILENKDDCKPKSKLESKIVQPVGNPQTANSFVNIDIDLDHMEVSDFIVRLSQAIRSEQTAILEYAALRSANGITSDDKQTIDAIIEEEKNHMVAITTILYKQLLMNHKENIKGANDEFVLPKFGAEEVFDNFEKGKLTESISTLVNKIITENADLKSEEMNVFYHSSTASQDQYEVEVDVDYDEDYIGKLFDSLVRSIKQTNESTYKEGYGICEDDNTIKLGSGKLIFMFIVKNTSMAEQDVVSDELLTNVCEKWFNNASTGEIYIKLK